MRNINPLVQLKDALPTVFISTLLMGENVS